MPSPGVRPDLGVVVKGYFGTCTRRISEGNARNFYAQLYAWNADGTKMMLHEGQIINAAEPWTQLLKQRWGDSPRWSPTDPNAIWSTESNRLVKFNATTGAKTTVATFPEYRALPKDANWEEMSRDGRYIALLGVRADNNQTEAFVYDVINNVKSPIATAANALNPAGLSRVPNWVKVSPLGKYVLANWPLGIGVYNMQMQWLGTVALGTGHSDIAVDANGVEWYVDHAANDASSPYPVNGNVIRKSRLPGGLDAYRAGDTTAVQTLLRLDWVHNLHVGCYEPNSCVVSTYRNPAVPDVLFDREIFKLSLDSRDCKGPNGGPCTDPARRDVKVTRLAHHRTAAPSCGYWATPFATSTRDGKQITYGSNWSAGCQYNEAYLLTLP